MMKFLFGILLFSLLSCASSQSKTKSQLLGKTYKSETIHHQYQDHKATVIVFLSAYCPCSNSHTEILKGLNRKFPKISFIGVHSNSNEKRAKAIKYFKEKDFGFPIIKDTNGKIARSFGAVKTPHVFIINQQGKTIYTGSVTNASLANESTENYLLEVLTEIQSGKEISHPQRKTLGCYIVLDGMEA